MGQYPYIHHLEEVEKRTGRAVVPIWLQKVTTSLVLWEWSRELDGHPDKRFRLYIMNGIENGFRIGFNRATICRLASSNMRSAVENASVVSDYLKKEMSLGRILGPIPPEAMSPGT